jgi:hypothetical protein
MKAKVKGVEFEVNNEEDLKLLSKFISRTEDEEFEKAEKTVMQEAEAEDRDSKISQAVEISKREGISFGRACRKIGFIAKGGDYRKAKHFGYKKSKQKQTLRDEMIARAVRLSAEKGIALSLACQELGFYASSPDYKLAKKLGYKKYSFRNKSSGWKKRKSMRFQRWTLAEDNIIKNNSPHRAKKLLSGRTMLAVYVRRKQLGVTSVRKGKLAKKIVFHMKDGKEVFVDKVKGKKWQKFTAEEDEIIRTKSLQEAIKILPHRSKTSIYRRRWEKGWAKKQKPTITKPTFEGITFDIFSRDENAQEKGNLYMAVLEHSARKKSPLTTREVSTVMQISIGEAKALLMDTFQQQHKIYEQFKTAGKMVLKNQDTLEFQ